MTEVGDVGHNVECDERMQERERAQPERKEEGHVTGEMAQWLRVLNLSSVRSTHIGKLTKSCTSSFRRPNTLSLSP